MSRLEFVRVSADGTQIIVRDETGRESALPMDDRIAAALIPRSSPAAGPDALSPREIQSRVRAGADVESLAEQTGTPVDRIMAFAIPILQERAHIATRARETLVRRAAGVGQLDDVIVARLQPLGISLVETHWDARRLDDGRWEVQLSYDTKEGGRIASWLYDAKAAVVTPIDDEAHWLMGEPPPAARPTREVVTKPTLPVFKQFEETADNVLPMKRREEAPTASDEDPTPEPPAPAPSGSKKSAKGRKSIPSWDEILFGSPPQDE